MTDGIASGLAVGLHLLDIEFDPNKPFRACLICGRVYQTPLDRAGTNPEWALHNREAWAANHAKAHSDREHHMLRISGLSMTPEAASKLAAYGVIPVLDAVTNEETAAALLESSPIPQDDAEY